MQSTNWISFFPLLVLQPTSFLAGTTLVSLCRGLSLWWLSDGSDSVSVQMFSHAFLRHSQPCFHLCANSILYSERGLTGEDKRLHLPLVTLNIVGWYKLAMTPLKSGQLHQLYHVWWSALHLCNSADGHTGTFFPAALLRKWPCCWWESWVLRYSQRFRNEETHVVKDKMPSPLLVSVMKVQSLFHKPLAGGAVTSTC